MTIDTNSTWKKFGAGVWNGMLGGVLTSPGVNGFHRTCVVACANNISCYDAFWRIYLGAIDGQGKSLGNFLVGNGPYLYKEGTRVFAKSAVFVLFAPWLKNEYYRGDPNESTKTACTVAAVLSGYEVFINPLDTWRTKSHNSEPLWHNYGKMPFGQFVRGLYSGAGLNGKRQFLQWFLYNKSNDWMDPLIQQYMGLNPYSSTGIVVKSYPQSLFLTSIAYPLFQRNIIELQLYLSLSEEAFQQKKSRYFVGAKHVIATQGYAGFKVGIWGKVMSNAWLLIQVNWITSLGKKK